MTETSDVSLNSDTHVLASTGVTRRNACGATTRRSACARVMPSAIAASTWPRRIELMPARNVSELYAVTLSDSAARPVASAGKPTR